MGNYSRHVLQTDTKQNFIIDSGSAPFVVDARHCDFTNTDSRPKTFGLSYGGHVIEGTVGVLKKDVQLKLLEQTNIESTNKPINVVCVPDLKKGFPDSDDNKILGLENADGIIGLALPGGKKACDACYTNAEVNLMHQTNMYGFQFQRNKNLEHETNLCGLHATPEHTIQPIPVEKYNMDEITKNKSINLVYPSACDNSSKKLFDIGWPREQAGTENFKRAYGVDMIDEGNIASLSVNYKTNKVSYELLD